MGLAACSSGSKENTGPAETILEQEPENKEPAISETNDDETSKPEAAEDTEKETVQDEEVIEADPITGIVKAYADDTITIKDPGDGLSLDIIQKILVAIIQKLNNKVTDFSPEPLKTF